MSNLTIQFLLRQLSFKDKDRERFNLLVPDFLKCKIIKAYHDKEKSLLFGIGEKFSFFEEGEITKNRTLHYFAELNQIYQEKIIRTCLSQIFFKPVLSVFRGITDTPLEQFLFVVYGQKIYINEYLYLTFDCVIRNGASLDKALPTLHDKMLEFVPEYQEFLNNNK